MVRYNAWLMATRFGVAKWRLTQSALVPAQYVAEEELDAETHELVVESLEGARRIARIVRRLKVDTCHSHWITRSKVWCPL